MKRLSLLRAAVAAAACLSAGCATQNQVSATYLLPPRAIADVHSVDILALDPVVRLSGNQAGEGDSDRVAGLTRQMLSMQLYRRGFYRTTDFLWGAMDGAAELGALLDRRQSRHGYATLIPEPDPSKAVLRIEIDLSYDANKTVKKQTFELETVPYIVNMPGDGQGGAVSETTEMAADLAGSLGLGGAAKILSTSSKVAKVVEELVPYSVPDLVNKTVERVDSSWEVWETDGKGKMHVSLVPAGADAPVYERDFDLRVPASAGRNAPPLPRIAAAALAPALEELVLDLSPNTEVRRLELNRSGDSAAVTLLEAGALTDAVEALEALPEDKRTIGDWENLGVAYEVLGDYNAASDAYEKALLMEPENEELGHKKTALAQAAKARKALRDSGAKANKDTSFQHPASR